MSFYVREPVRGIEVEVVAERVVMELSDAGAAAPPPPFWPKQQHTVARSCELSGATTMRATSAPSRPDALITQSLCSMWWTRHDEDKRRFALINECNHAAVEG
jgi:hypothetical protein